MEEGKVYIRFKVMILSHDVNWEKTAVQLSALWKSQTPEPKLLSEHLKHFNWPQLVNFNLGFTPRSILNSCIENISVITLYPMNLVQQITGSKLGEWWRLTQQEVCKMTKAVFTEQCLHIFRTIIIIPLCFITILNVEQLWMSLLFLSCIHHI